MAKNIAKSIVKHEVYGMTCSSCEKAVERELAKLEGVSSVKANVRKKFVRIEYDEAKCTPNDIQAAIKRAGYSTEKPRSLAFIGLLLVIGVVYFAGFSSGGFDMESKLANGSYAILFLVGMLTSVHCVGMCGGIMLTQTIGQVPKSRFQASIPALKYNAGRVVAYTVLGGIVGALGSVFSITITTKALVSIIAGFFMVMMGLNMYGFSLLKKLRLTLPVSMCNIKSKISSPFIVGLLNGFMPCGPLQTMQIYALSTGSAVAGALSMLVFSLGTVPLMLTFGVLSGLLSKGNSKNLVRLSGALVIGLGLVMCGRGLALAGVTGMLPINSDAAQAVISSEVTEQVQIINMTADNKGYTPNVFTVKKGVPVKWVIDGKELNGCNNAITVPALNLEQKLVPGENVIEFTPTEDINFTCWMGMIGGRIQVVDN